MLRRVCGTAERCKRKDPICAMVVLDIKNAFNTLRWRRILEEARERRLPGQLMRILGDHLSKRKIVVLQEEEIAKRIYAGVSQGSALGPLLWISVYDGLLRALDSFKDVDAVALADDLALMITIRKMHEIGDRVCGLLETVADWCNDAGLRLAIEKTEVILLTGKRVPKVFIIDVGRGGNHHQRKNQV